MLLSLTGIPSADGRNPRQQQEERKTGEILKEFEKLLQADPELARDPALLGLVQEDLLRYQQGDLKPATLSDPIASELELMERLQSEGLTQEEARDVSRQFHALREDILSLYLEAAPKDEKRLKRFQEQLEERLKTKGSQLEKSGEAQKEESRRISEERLEQRQEGAQKDR